MAAAWNLNKTYPAIWKVAGNVLPTISPQNVVH